MGSPQTAQKITPGLGFSGTAESSLSIICLQDPRPVVPVIRSLAPSPKPVKRMCPGWPGVCPGVPRRANKFAEWLHGKSRAAGRAKVVHLPVLGKETTLVGY